ncbi:hypothetical protein [Marinovum sp.]|uniref:hypothetical protein n=1 Tax=Marinovum sp. TaxID=2024839 RepID=UPI002B268BA9|nr:hypothetical protein [Marinovum sp.]
MSGTGTPRPARDPSTTVLAASTLVAALFVAVQAWYARTSFVEASETRFLERKLDICFDNFDDAAELDRVLRAAVPEMLTQEVWPPQVAVETPERLALFHREVVPKLDALDAGLTKASVLESLDKYRAYLAQKLRGLSKRLRDVSPGDLSPENTDTQAVFAALSEFLGGQYQVLTGCRLVAEGKA